MYRLRAALSHPSWLNAAHGMQGAASNRSDIFPLIL